jgi:hypothetical protein
MIFSNGATLMNFKFANKEYILSAIRANSIHFTHVELLQFASEELRNDKEVVLEAIKYNKLNFEFASTSLRDDKEVALEAVANNMQTLQYASERLRGDRDVVYNAIKEHGMALISASEEI